MDNENERASRLALADRHIADGRLRIAAQAKRVEKLREKGIDAASAEQLLRVMQDVLNSFLELRQLIQPSQQAERSRGPYAGRPEVSTRP